MNEIIVIAGCMYASKTEHLIHLLKREALAGKSLAVYKPALENRYSADAVVSHNNRSIPSTPIESPAEMLSAEADVIGIDEAQFFDSSIIEVVEALVDSGKKVIITGLDQDYRGKPFGPMPELLAIADKVIKLTAICTVCGAEATKTFRLSNSEELVELGSTNQYEARCRLHSKK